MESNKVLGSAKMVMLIALVFNLIMIGISAVLNVLGFGAGIVTKGGTAAGVMLGFGGAVLLWFASWGVLLVTILGNIAIFAYGGHRAAKKGNDLVGCGMVGSVSYALVGAICGIVQLVMSFFGIGANVFTSGSTAAGMFTGLLGAFGLGMGFLCGTLWFIAGLLVNFLVSLIGGMMGGAK